MRSRLDKAIAAVTMTVGLGSFLIFGLFLWTGGLQWVDFGMSPGAALAWDGLLCLVFFVQHSGMVRKSFRAWLSGVTPACYHGALYTIASGAALVLLSTCWQPSHIAIVALEGSGWWLMRCLFLLSVLGLAWGIRALGNFDAFGIQAIRARTESGPPQPVPLTIRGPYQWVRHPLYAFSTLAIWACPILSADRFLCNALFTAWIGIGATLEERDLLAQFGGAYRAYQQKVPMLAPWWPPR